MKSRIKFNALSGPTDKEVAAAKAVLLRRDEACAARAASARVQCAAIGLSPGSPIKEPCGKWFPIAEAVYIDVQHWVPPYGCTGGGYHRSGEGHFVCPRCGYLNRAFGRDKIAELRKYFQRTVTAYEPESCFDRRLRFNGGEGYPYPDHVAAQIELEAAQDEIRKAEARVAALKSRAAA